MAEIFSEDYALMWALALAVALFFPVRQLIWTLYVRRAQNEKYQKESSADLPDEEIQRLKKRAGITSALLVFIFAVLYTNQFFQGSP